MEQTTQQVAYVQSAEDIAYKRQKDAMKAAIAKMVAEQRVFKTERKSSLPSYRPGAAADHATNRHDLHAHYLAYNILRNKKREKPVVLLAADYVSVKYVESIVEKYEKAVYPG